MLTGEPVRPQTAYSVCGFSIVSGRQENRIRNMRFDVSGTTDGQDVRQNEQDITGRLTESILRRSVRERDKVIRDTQTDV